MGLDLAHYHAWEGKLGTPWRSCAAIVRVGLLQLFRRKSYWVVLALGLLNFLVFWSVIYAVTQFQLPERAQRELLDVFGFRATAESGQDSGYVMFMHRQSLVVMILLAFSGSLLVGSDFRSGALPFYLSRRIDRLHYIVGKLLATAAAVALLTIVPAFVLFIEFGSLTTSTEYWRDNWRIALAILSYGGVLCAVLSIWLVTLSAYLQRMAPIAITWSSLFVMLGAVAGMLRQATDNPAWGLLDPWRDMRLVGRMAFGVYREAEDADLAPWALGILIVTCTLALLALWRRVRAIEIVE